MTKKDEVYLDFSVCELPWAAISPAFIIATREQRASTSSLNGVDNEVSWCFTNMECDVSTIAVFVESRRAQITDQMSRRVCNSACHRSIVNSKYHRINSGSWLVQYNQRILSKKCAGDGDFPSLPSTEVHFQVCSHEDIINL